MMTDSLDTLIKLQQPQQQSKVISCDQPQSSFLELSHQDSYIQKSASANISVNRSDESSSSNIGSVRRVKSDNNNNNNNNNNNINNNNNYPKWNEQQQSYNNSSSSKCQKLQQYVSKQQQQQLYNANYRYNNEMSYNNNNNNNGYGQYDNNRRNTRRNKSNNNNINNISTNSSSSNNTTNSSGFNYSSSFIANNQYNYQITSNIQNTNNNNNNNNHNSYNHSNLNNNTYNQRHYNNNNPNLFNVKAISLSPPPPPPPPIIPPEVSQANNNNRSIPFHPNNRQMQVPQPPQLQTISFQQQQLQLLNNFVKQGASNPSLNPIFLQPPKDIDEQIQEELDAYKELQKNMSYSSWAHLLNPIDETSKLVENQAENEQQQQQQATIQTQFYQADLKKQLEESCDKLDKGDLKHYQVDISEQDNSSPFEYLKQFKIENNNSMMGVQSMKDDYLDIMENLDLYTEKLYYAIQDKVQDHLKKNNFNTQTLLVNNSSSNTMINNNNYNYLNTPLQQIQMQLSIQGQRNHAKSIIKGAVQNVLEYSENRTVVPRYAREGDWLCQCGNLNFQYRNSCNKCNILKPKYQYTKSTDLHLKLDQMEKQLRNIDSNITSPPPQEQIITQQRQIILSDFIWVCKCCRSINYSKSSTCVSCNMYKYIDRNKLSEITKGSQTKLSKQATKMQERYQKIMQHIQDAQLKRSQDKDNNSSQESQESQELQESQESQINQECLVSSSVEDKEKLEKVNLDNSAFKSLSSDEMNTMSQPTLNNNNINNNTSTEDLNTSDQQILLNSSIDSYSDQGKMQKMNTSLVKERIFILDQIDKSCDADYSSSESCELEMKQLFNKQNTPSSSKKSTKKSLLKSSKCKKKSSKIQFLQELNDEPQKRKKSSSESSSTEIDEHDRTIIDEIYPIINTAAAAATATTTTDDNTSDDNQQLNSYSSTSKSVGQTKDKPTLKIIKKYKYIGEERVQDQEQQQQGNNYILQIDNQLNDDSISQSNDDRLDSRFIQEQDKFNAIHDHYNHIQQTTEHYNHFNQHHTSQNTSISNINNFNLSQQQDQEDNQTIDPNNHHSFLYNFGQ